MVYNPDPQTPPEIPVPGPDIAPPPLPDLPEPPPSPEIDPPGPMDDPPPTAPFRAPDNG